MTLHPTGDLARTDADEFVYNPVSDDFSLHPSASHPVYQNVSPLDDVASNDVRRLYVVALLPSVLTLIECVAGIRLSRAGGV